MLRIPLTIDVSILCAHCTCKHLEAHICFRLGHGKVIWYRSTSAGRIEECLLTGLLCQFCMHQAHHVSAVTTSCSTVLSATCPQSTFCCQSFPALVSSSTCAEFKHPFCCNSTSVDSKAPSSALLRLAEHAAYGYSTTLCCN